MPGPVLGTLAHLPKALVAGVAGAVVLAGGAVAAVQLTSGNDADQLADASKVLQSVDVGVGQNGRLTSIKGTTVGTTTAGKQFSVDQSYEPGKVADQLPVRVLTSYRTAKGTGTDLADLDGYTGRVDITLTVQNLTQKAKNVTFDVGGTQQSRSALVGVPLTVVGSTSLPDTKPSDVVTQADRDDDAGTNGVLSQDSKGKTQVQWATLLAPPQLGASTAMNLSVNAKDFSVPDFDLSVQPGLVTDPSIGSVLNEAFAPEGSSQLDLTRRTIDLIGKVNGVLGQAGKSMSQVRSTLNNSSETLGTKTVSDLKGSTETISSSVKGLQESSTSLGQDLTSSLKGTQSTTLSELQATTQAIDTLLGDTKSPLPTVKYTEGVPGNQCSRTPIPPTGASSIYGNLQEIVALLNGYSTATDNCAKGIKDRILTAVGPDLNDPNDPSCAVPGKNETRPDYSRSASCSLVQAHDDLKKLAEDLDLARDAAVSTFTTGVKALKEAVEGVSQTDPVDRQCDGTNDGAAPNRDGLLWFAYQFQKCASFIGFYGNQGAQQNPDGPVVIDPTELQNAIISARNGVAALGNYLNQVASAGVIGEQDVQGASTKVSDAICGLAGQLALSGDLSAASSVQDLRKLTNNRTCGILGVGSGPFDGVNDADTLDGKISAQIGRWNSLSTSQNQAFKNLDQAIGTIDNQASTLISQVNKIRKDYNVEAVTKAYGNLNEYAKAFNAKVAIVQEQTAVAVGDSGSGQGDSVTKQLTDSFNAAKTGALNADASVADGRVVGQASGDTRRDVDALFAASLGQLSGSAKEIAEKSKATIEKSKATFAVRQKQSGDRISASVTKGLQQVDAGVGSSVKDLGAAKTILQGDITDVLLDLGTRNVKGSGLLGAIARSAATTGTANFQLAQATTTASSYANVRQGDVADLLLRQAQAQAGQEAQQALPAFALTLPDSTRHTTVYSLHITS